MNNFKKIFFLVIAYFSYYKIWLSYKTIQQEDIYWTVWWKWTVIDNIDSNNGLTTFDNLLIYFKNSIFTLLELLVIAVFIYIWWRLVVARWKPDEFKKALTHFIYVVVWIFLISSAWAIVKIVTWLSF